MATIYTTSMILMAPTPENSNTVNFIIILFFIGLVGLILYSIFGKKVLGSFKFSLFTPSNNYTLDHIRGVVVSASKYYNQEVKSRGGGGYVTEGGYIAPPTIYTETKTIVEIFVKASNDREVPITIGYDLAIREGHNIIFVSAWNQKKEGFWVASYNETTDCMDYFADPRGIEKVVPLKQKIDFKIGILVFIVVFVLAFLFHAASNSFIILVLTIIGILLYNKIIVINHNSNVKKEFDNAIKDFIKDKISLA